MAELSVHSFRVAAMWNRSIVLVVMWLSPALGLGCEWSDRHECREALRQLIEYRSEAMEYAFGSVFDGLPHQIEVHFVTAHSEPYHRYSGRVAYDAGANALIVPVRLINARMPAPLQWASSYWTYYSDRRYPQAFPLIADIDNALWGAVLQEHAHAKGKSWPHAGCKAIDLARRLPCEMLVSAVGALLTERQLPMFNANAVNRIWPEHLTAFERSSWRSDRDYADVQQYGGILLLQPLFSEFGAARVLAYVAQTPFQVEGDNMQASARHYQEQARTVLRDGAAVAADASQPSVEGGEQRFIVSGSPDGS